MNKSAAHIVLCFESPSSKRIVKQISFDLTANETANFDLYCVQTGKGATDVIRELIQGLPVT